MDLGLKGKVAMVAGASRGLGYAVAEALAREGAMVSIASRDEQAIDRRGRRASAATSLAVPVDVRSADAIRRWADETQRAVRRRRSAVHQLRRPAGRRRHVVRRCGVAGCGGAAAVQRAADGAGRRAVDAGARRRRDPDVHLVVGEGADPEPRAVDRAAGVGVGAGEDAGARARAVEDPRQPDHSRPRSTPIASGSSTRSPARSRASRRAGESRSRWRRFRWAATARPTSTAGSARSCCRTPPAT